MKLWGQHIGFNVCKRRLALGLTIEEAAKRALIAPERWIEIEQGDLKVTMHEYDCIIYVLKLGPLDLIFRRDKAIDLKPRVVH